MNSMPVWLINKSYKQPNTWWFFIENSQNCFTLNLYINFLIKIFIEDQIIDYFLAWC